MSNSSKEFMQNMYRTVVPQAIRKPIYRMAPKFVRQYINGSIPTDHASHSPLPELKITDLRLPLSPPTPSRFPQKVCKLCDEADWNDAAWLDYMDALGEPQARHTLHRKAWEWGQGVYGLEQLGLLQEDALALGVGAGVESVLFYLANRIAKVYATDIYGKGEFAALEADEMMLKNPQQFARIPFREDHLTVLPMNGLNLAFPDNFFDFAFSFSSIEHFGGHEAARRAVCEMSRVIKPGGAVVLTTEVVLNGRYHDEFFLPHEIEQYLIRDTGLQLIEEIDYTLSETTLSHMVDCQQPDYHLQTPHIILNNKGVIWTSICLILQKPI